MGGRLMRLGGCLGARMWRLADLFLFCFSVYKVVK